MLKSLKKIGSALSTAGLGAGAMLMSIAPAQAAFAVPTEVTDAAVSVGLVGAAVFTISVGVKLYKWITRAL